MISLESIQKILNNKDSEEELDTFYIFLNKENSFLSNQYLQAISKHKGLPIVYIDKIDDLIPNKSDIFGTTIVVDDTSLYVYKVDKFEFVDVNIKNIKNLIIVCDSIDKESLEVFNHYIVEMPKLEDWHIKDYVYSLADGVDKKKLDWLMNICNKDIYRLDNELSKLSLFNKKERDLLFESFANDGMFNDLSGLVVFDLTNAILKRDVSRVGEILEEIKNFDCEPLGVNTILVNSFRNVIQMQLSLNPTIEKLGIKSNQFYAIKKNCGYYSKEQLLKIYDIITMAEYKMKNGEISNDQLIDYMVLNIFSL